MPRVRRWDYTPREEAERLAAEWDAIEVSRLAWLDERLGEAGFSGHGLVDLVTLWNWFRGWVPSEEALRGQPEPVWVIPGDRKWVYPVEKAVAADAVALAMRRRLEAALPMLERVIGPPHVKGKYPPVDCNHPGLAVRGGDGSLVYKLAVFPHFMASDAEDPAFGSDYLQTRFDKVVAEVDNASRDEVAVVGAVDAVDVEHWGDGAPDDVDDYAFELGIEESVAWDHEDLVVAYAAAVGELPGVREAFHQDREQILVAGTITEAALIKHATRWWTDHLPT